MPRVEPVKFPVEAFPPHTPVEHAAAFRLESGGEGAVNEWNRWSYAAEPPILLLKCDASNHVTTLYSSGGTVREWHDPLEALRWMEHFRREESTIDGPPFKGGWIGYLSYDLGRVFEPDKLPATPRVRRRDDLRLPLFQFTYHDRLFAHDRLNGETFRIRTQARRASSPRAGAGPGASGTDAITITPNYGAAGAYQWRTFTRRGYEKSVERVIDYIKAGDVFQVNLSQRFSVPLTEQPHVIYNRLHRTTPGWFGAYFGYSDMALISNSPELFLRVTPQRQVMTRPIKGTRRRGVGMDEELRASEKDQAELNMIVDLERNDLGRVCEIGSVRVVEPRVIEAHPTVYHGAATITGKLRSDVTFPDLLAATFPGGSVTGAPKIRAMQIIDELEPAWRGPYCGAIGYLSCDGHIQFNLAIRTMVVARGRVHVHVGGGIVADSVPAAEYDETIVKARAMFDALGVDAEEAVRGYT